MYSSLDIVDKIEIENSREKEMNVVVKEDISYVQNRSQDSKVEVNFEYGTLIPPLSTEDVIGHLALYRDGENIASYPLYLESEVHALSFSEKFYNYFKILT